MNNKHWWHKLSEALFFSNLFYGICAAALCLETIHQLNLPHLPWHFYVFTGLITTAFYIYAYLPQQLQKSSVNKRNQWYINHIKKLKFFNYIIVLSIILIGGWYTLLFAPNITKLPVWQIVFCGILLTVAILYYGIENNKLSVNLRKIGWLKPFIIGFVWAGTVSFLPILFSGFWHHHWFPLKYLFVFLFIKNMMFITVLCILFDIKDYAMDYNHHLQTHVVKFGLRNTIYKYVVPLIILGLIALYINAWLLHFNAYRLAINTLPFIAAVIVAFSLQKRRPIIYYLSVIDGLMLFKALCGIIGMYIK